MNEMGQHGKNFFVRFIGHVNERIRPEGFPREIYVDYVLQEVTDEQLKNMVQAYMDQFVKQNGMVAKINHSETEDETRLSFNKKMFVPMFMIAFIDISVSIIADLLPQEVTEGKVQLGEGKEIPLQ